MLKAPFRSPYKLTVTQEWGNKSYVDWYKANGVNIPMHNGIDIVFGDARQTYGTECICPFPLAKVVKVTPKPLDPNSTKGNGVTIEADLGGKIYQIVFWHTGEIVVTEGQILRYGDVVCYIGNSGLCNPKPTEDQPWNGAHCHFMLFIYDWMVTPRGSYWQLRDSDNGVGGSINPRWEFNFSIWETGQDTGKWHDVWALIPWVKNLFGLNLVNFFKKIKF